MAFTDQKDRRRSCVAEILANVRLHSWITLPDRLYHTKCRICGSALRPVVKDLPFKRTDKAIVIISLYETLVTYR